MIIERYPLAEVPEAMRYLGAGHPHGKIVITISTSRRLKGISDFWCVWRAYARHTHQKSSFFEVFRELLTIVEEER